MIHFVCAPNKLFAALCLNRFAKLPEKHFLVCVNYAKDYYYGSVFPCLLIIKISFPQGYKTKPHRTTERIGNESTSRPLPGYKHGQTWQVTLVHTRRRLLVQTFTEVWDGLNGSVVSICSHMCKTFHSRGHCGDQRKYVKMGSATLDKGRSEIII